MPIFAAFTSDKFSLSSLGGDSEPKTVSHSFPSKRIIDFKVIDDGENTHLITTYVGGLSGKMVFDKIETIPNSQLEA